MSVTVLHTTKTDVYGEFKELIPEIREKIADYVYSRVGIEDSKSKKKYEVLDKLKKALPEEHKLITELEDIILAIECERIEKAIFYALENGEELKRVILGF